VASSWEKYVCGEVGGNNRVILLALAPCISDAGTCVCVGACGIYVYVASSWEQLCD